MRPRTSWLSPALARSRSRRIRELHYELDLRIDAGARRLRGRQRIALTLDRHGAGQALILDWRPGGSKQAIERTCASLRVNGEAVARASVRVAEGHLVIAARLLRSGLNRIDLQWEAPIDAAGSALTRYRDPNDGRLYVYTLFVPADASSVFPCFDQPDLKARFSLSLTLPSDWQAIANAPLALDRSSRRTRFLRFAPTGHRLPR